LLAFADLHLVGCGEYGREFKDSGIAVTPAYELDEMPAIMRSIQPDLGLLLSAVPETFSYTLQELFELAIPPVATQVGSFADRIADGVNGFLVELLPSAVVDRLRKLAADRAPLDCVHRYLKANPPRRVNAMLADYEALMNLPGLSERAYFAPNEATGEDSDHGFTPLPFREIESGGASPATPQVAVVHPAEHRTQPQQVVAGTDNNGFSLSRIDAEALKQELRLAQKRIDDLENSVSWRTTRPLRAISGPLFKTWKRIRRRRSVSSDESNQAN